jgi:acyl-CoA thioester hydrolase
VRHLYECPIRRADLHPGGAVDNVAYLDYLQEARLELLRHHGTSVSARAGEGLVVVRTVIEYHVPLTLANRPLHVATWVTEVRAASFTLGYELTTGPEGSDAPVVHARATTVLTPYDFTDNRPRRLTADERARLLVGVEPSPLTERDRPPKPAPWARDAWREPVRVRFSDIDLLGHVNNVRYLDYIHEAAVDLMLDCFREAGVDGQVDTVIARTEIDYVGQLNLRPEPYDLWARVAAVGTTSVTFEVEIRDGDRVMARSRAVEVSVDEDARPRPFVAAHREVFLARLEAARVTRTR